MAYISTINDNTYRIDPGETTSQRSVTIDEATYTIDWHHISPLAADKGLTTVGGRYSLLIAGKSYEVFVHRVNKPDEGNSQTYEIILEGQRYEVKVEDEREKALAGSAQYGLDTGEARVRAPMPGLVVGVPLEEGASVTRGQTVVVLEAMKMENDLASPITGTIKEVRVTKGQTVNQGDVLVVVTGE